MPNNVSKWLPTLDGGVCIDVAVLKRIHSEKDSTASYLSIADWTVVTRLLQVQLLHMFHSVLKYARPANDLCIFPSVSERI